MENQVEKKMENEMDTGGIEVSKEFDLKVRFWGNHVIIYIYVYPLWQLSLNSVMATRTHR